MSQSRTVLSKTLLTGPVGKKHRNHIWKPRSACDNHRLNRLEVLPKRFSVFSTLPHIRRVTVPNFMLADDYSNTDITSTINLDEDEIEDEKKQIQTAKEERVIQTKRYRMELPPSCYDVQDTQLQWWEIPVDGIVDESQALHEEESQTLIQIEDDSQDLFLNEDGSQSKERQDLLRDGFGATWKRDAWKPDPCRIRSKNGIPIIPFEEEDTQCEQDETVQSPDFPLPSTLRAICEHRGIDYSGGPIDFPRPRNPMRKSGHEPDDEDDDDDILDLGDDDLPDLLNDDLSTADSRFKRMREDEKKKEEEFQKRQKILKDLIAQSENMAEGKKAAKETKEAKSNMEKNMPPPKTPPTRRRDMENEMPLPKTRFHCPKFKNIGA